METTSSKQGNFPKNTTINWNHKEKNTEIHWAELLKDELIEKVLLYEPMFERRCRARLHKIYVDYLFEDTNHNKRTLVKVQEGRDEWRSVTYDWFRVCST